MGAFCPPPLEFGRYVNNIPIRGNRFRPPPTPRGFLDRPTALQKIMNESAQASWTLHCSSKENIGHMQYLTSCYFGPGGIHKCRRPFFIRFQWPGHYPISFPFLEADFFYNVILT